MSTRASIKMTDSFSQTLWFYRHSDGYPSVTGKSLETFMGWLKSGAIRDNCSQAGGWLIVLGREEYLADGYCAKTPGDDAKRNGMGWKVGAYEPATQQADDAEYVYHIDLKAKTLTTTEV